MNNRTSDNQSVILSAIKKLGASLRNEIRKGDNALRAEMKSGNKAIRQEALKVEGRVENLEEGQKTIEGRIGDLESGQNRILDQMKEQHDEVMTSVSNFAGRVQDIEDENALGTEQYQDHETRISKLEMESTQT